MINTQVKKQIRSQVLKDPQGFGAKYSALLFDTASTLIRPYTRELPVNKGDARRNVRVTKLSNFSYKIGVEGNSRKTIGYVYEGTGKYRGGIDAGYTSGRVRKANNYGFGSKQDALSFFKRLRWLEKKTGRTYISSKPNKFSDRAYDDNHKKTVLFFDRELKKLL